MLPSHSNSLETHRMDSRNLIPMVDNTVGKKKLTLKRHMS